MTNETHTWAEAQSPTEQELADLQAEVQIIREREHEEKTQ